MLIVEGYFSEGKLKNDFGAAFRYLYTHLFWSLSRDILLESFLFWSLSRDISKYGTFFLFWYVCTESKSVLFLFQFYFVNFYRSFQMAASMLQTIPSFYTKLAKKSLFISANTNEKYIVCKDYCIAHLDDRTCFLPACKYHILLRGKYEELLKKLDLFCFTYQHVDCLYTLFKYQLSGKVIAKSGQVFDKLQRAVDFNQRNKALDRMPSIAKKRLSRKNLQKHLFSSSRKTKTTQTSRSVFAERFEKIKKTKFGLELIKIFFLMVMVFMIVI